MKMQLTEDKEFKPITVTLTFESEIEIETFFNKSYVHSYSNIQNYESYGHPFNKFQQLVKFGKINK